MLNKVDINTVTDFQQVAQNNEPCTPWGKAYIPWLTTGDPNQPAHLPVLSGSPLFAFRFIISDQEALCTFSVINL